MYVQCTFNAAAAALAYHRLPASTADIPGLISPSQIMTRALKGGGGSCGEARHGSEAVLTRQHRCSSVSAISVFGPSRACGKETWVNWGARHGLASPRNNKLQRSRSSHALRYRYEPWNPKKRKATPSDGPNGEKSRYGIVGGEGTKSRYFRDR